MMRFAIWTAVSSPSQAKVDKVSLVDQENACRQLGLERGWVESAEVFQVRGQSRTRWINLSDAAKAIPALDALLRSARRHEFDVLLCWDFTRFRDLLKSISNVLADSGIQLYSLAQPIEPIDPATYDPRETDTAEILEDANSMASRLESKNRQRRWRIGMTGRVASGLHFARVPYGYRKPAGHEYDRRAALEPDPIKARLLRELKDHFLAGQSLSQLVEFLDRSGLPSPDGGHWTNTTIRHILRNPYYSGYVFFGRNPAHRDRLTGRILSLTADPSRVLLVRGQHAPLWDDAAQARIDREFKRRGRAFTGRASYALSQLLHCDRCGRMMWYKGDPNKTGRHYWRCRTGILDGGRGHAHINNDQILDALAAALQRAVRGLGPLPAPVSSGDRLPDIKTEQANLTARKQRWLDAFEVGTLSAEDFAGRLQTINDRLAAMHRELDDARDAKALREHRSDLLQTLSSDVDRIPVYLHQGDPQEVNAALHEILAGVYVARDHTIRLDWR